MSPVVRVGLVALAMAASSCASLLGPGEVGVPRVAGFVRGQTPLATIPPVSDRDGNIYLLSGLDDPFNVRVFAGRRGGGFSADCRLTKGDSLGARGWVGFTSGRMFYWSGYALVSVAASSGDCQRMLDRDPSSGSDLQFRAVFPYVYDSERRTSLVAMVQAPGDRAPFTVVVDLDARIYVEPRGFEPAEATDVRVHGVGASAARREEYLLVSWSTGEDARAYEGRILDERGTILSRVSLGDLGDLPEGCVPGFLQANDAGLIVGLLPEGRTVIFDADGGRVQPTPDWTLGVHSWEGTLYAGGADQDLRPLVARIDNGGDLGSVEPWEASSKAASSVGDANDVVDDRTPPRRDVTFDRPRNAIGPAPFVSPFAPARYAEGETLVLVAGDQFGEGADTFTQVAIAPAGIEYP